MQTDREVLLPKHFSASALKMWNTCPKQWQLKRLVQEPETPAWWFVTGSAFHAATEYVDKAMPVYSKSTASEFNLQEVWTDAFNGEVQVRMDQVPDIDQWNCASRAKVKPTGEQNYKAEYDKGLQWFGEYLDWRAGKPELEITHVEEQLFEPIEGSPVPLKGFVDRVALYKGAHLVYDLKSGSTIEKNPLQLGLYRVGLKRKLDIETRWGYYYQTKQNEFGSPHDLRRWDEPLIASYAKRWYGGIERGEFLPHPGDGCFRCPFRSHCYMVSGDTPDTRIDPLNPNYGVAINV